MSNKSIAPCTGTEQTRKYSRQAVLRIACRSGESWMQSTIIWCVLALGSMTWLVLSQLVSYLTNSVHVRVLLGKLTLQKPDLLGSAQERGEPHGALPNLLETPELHSTISQPMSDPKRESIRYNLTKNGKTFAYQLASGTPGGWTNLGGTPCRSWVLPSKSGFCRVPLPLPLPITTCLQCCNGFINSLVPGGAEGLVTSQFHGDNLVRSLVVACRWIRRKMRRAGWAFDRGQLGFLLRLVAVIVVSTRSLCRSQAIAFDTAQVVSWARGGG
jgi:hypothetical protein